MRAATVDRKEQFKELQSKDELVQKILNDEVTKNIDWQYIINEGLKKCKWGKSVL